MGRRSPTWLGASLGATLLGACNLITGASDLETSTLLEASSEGGPDAVTTVDGSSASDASSDRGESPTKDGGGTDARPDSGCVALNGTCNAQVCCGSTACAANGRCAASCTAQGGACTYANRDRCCFGFGCNLTTNKCGACKNDGLACTEPDGLDPSCCGGICFKSKCVTD